MGFDTEYPNRKDWRRPQALSPPDAREFPKYATTYRYKTRKLLLREQDLITEHELLNWTIGLTEDEIIEHAVAILTHLKE